MSDLTHNPLVQAVFLAAQEGDAKAIKAIFSALRNDPRKPARSATVAALANSVDSEGKTPLIYAASLGPRGRDAAIALLAGGASPSCEQPSSSRSRRAFRLDFFSQQGKSALCFAAETNATGTIDALLTKGARPDKKSVDELGRQPLSIAAANGFIHACSLLLSKGSPDLVWAQDHQGLTAVAHACSAGSVDIVDMLLKASPGTPSQWLARSAEGLSLMEHAAQYSNAECVESLAARVRAAVRDVPEMAGAMRPRYLPSRWVSPSPLSIAASRGSFDVFHAILLESWWLLSPVEIAVGYANPNASPEIRSSGNIAVEMASSMKISASAKAARCNAWNEFSLLSEAILNPHFTLAQFSFMLDQSCRLLFRNAPEAISLCSSGAFSKAPRALASAENKIEREARQKDSLGSIRDAVNLFAMVTPHGQSLIAIAIERNRPEALKAILAMAHCLALTDDSPRPSPQQASMGGSAEEAGALSPQESYPWIRAHGAMGLTPLARAASAGCLESCEALLDQGARASDLDIHGWTPYMRAAQHGHVSIMSLFEKRDCAARLQDARTFFGETPAMIASSCSQREALSFLCSTPELLALRASETRLDGTTALMLATSQSDLACMRLLLDASDANAQNEKGATALAIACHDMSKDAVGILAPLTNPLLTDIDGMTPLIYAMWRSPSFPDGASCVDILSDFQNPDHRFSPSAKINARFGDKSYSSFNAPEWAEFLFKHVAGHQSRNDSEGLLKKIELWSQGLLPPRQPLLKDIEPAPLTEMSGLSQPLAMEKLAILARERIVAIEGAPAKRFPRRANRS